MTLERVVQVRPAYDKRDPDPKKNYGVHGADLIFGLKGEAGAVQFVIFTNWYLPGVADEMWKKGNPRIFFSPMPADVGYHSPKPLYEDQNQISEACEWLDGKPCYYDGSGLHAEEVFTLMIAEGHEAMWKHLEEYYLSIFSKKS
jgi:hypothetical protein